MGIEKFVGGTVYQGFLSPHTYHRFHAPCSGKVTMAKVVEGTYFSQPYDEDKPANYIESQGYLAHVATRGIIVIDTGDPLVGSVCFIPIGMVDVSTVDLDDLKGKTHVNKGDEIGTFHFGGSSHLIMFEKDVQVDIDLQGLHYDKQGDRFLKVNTALATVTGRKPRN